MGIFKKLGWFFKQNKRSYAIAIAALVLVEILNVIPSRILGIVVDLIVGSNLTLRVLVIWLGVLLIIGIVQYGLRYIWRNGIYGNSARLQYILRQRLYHHLSQMDAEFYQNYRTGDLMAHTTNDINNIHLVAGNGIYMTANIISSGAATIAAMVFIVDWRLTLVTIIPLFSLVFIYRYIGKLTNKRFAFASASFSELNNKVQESIQGIKVIKSVGQEKKDTEQFKQFTQNTVDANEDVLKIDSILRPLVVGVEGFAYMVAIIYGGYLVMQNAITIGDLVMFVNYISMIILPMSSIGRLFNTLEKGDASYNRVLHLMEEESSIMEADNPVTQPINGNLSYDINAFSFPNSDKLILQNIHFNLNEGQTLGVVGPTGASKTTLFKLLMREYDQYEGQITYGGKDIRDYSFDALLLNIGYVAQNNFLFSDTIANNIRFSDPELDLDRVVEAAKAADVHEDIKAFPNGYQEQIGERGVQLSGGQKQRLTIARALINQPELLILDNSLSAVDAQTESNIIHNLNQMRSNKTTIISANRLNSIRNADEIIVMEDGQIMERGTHEQLLAEEGWYARVYHQQQLEAYLEEAVK